MIRLEMGVFAYGCTHMIDPDRDEECRKPANHVPDYHDTDDWDGSAYCDEHVEAHR